MFGAYYQRSSLSEMLGSLLDGLSMNNLEI